MENEVLKCINNRKSVRAFSDQAISKEEEQAILNAAIQAPSAGNQELYTILKITDSAILKELAIACDNQIWITKGKLILVFLADPLRWYKAYQLTDCKPRKLEEGDLLLAIDDALIASENAVLAAESMGIGSCYIGDVMEQKEKITDLLKLPRYIFPACLLVFGYPTQQQKERRKPERFALEDLVFENTYPEMDEAYLKKMFHRQVNGTNRSLEQSMQAFCQRKYNSDFSREMSRSVKAYLKDYQINEEES